MLLSKLLFGLIFIYGLAGLFRIVDFNLSNSIGLTIPATICGVLAHATRLRNLTASLPGGSKLSVTMNDTNNGASNGRNQRRNNARKTLARDGETDSQAAKTDRDTEKAN